MASEKPVGESEQKPVRYNRYGTLSSWVYNLDKPIGRSFGDLEYYQQRLAGCKGPILEPAVGNGRILVPLLQAGFDIEGFDASQEMLSYCRGECHARGLTAKLTKQTFEGFHSEKRFEAIIIPAGSFQLITDEGAALSALTRLYDHLVPEGRVIIDLDPIGDVLATAGPPRSWTTEYGELLTLTDSEAEINYIAQTVLTHSRYEHWREGVLVATELEQFALRWWGVGEFRLALQSVGFTDVHVSGNYEHSREPKPTDAVYTFEARRPE